MDHTRRCTYATDFLGRTLWEWTLGSGTGSYNSGVDEDNGDTTILITIENLAVIYKLTAV